MHERYYSFFESKRECMLGPDGFGEKIRQRGKEFGTTTGRPRRCGWFDGVAARHAARINHFDNVCIPLLDVLDDFDEIGVRVGYRLDGEPIEHFPASCHEADAIEPIYEMLPGWKCDTTGVREWADLPEAARSYLGRLGELIGCEVAVVGVGPGPRGRAGAAPRARELPGDGSVVHIHYP